MARTTPGVGRCAVSRFVPAALALAFCSGCFGPWVSTSQIVERLKPQTSLAANDTVLIDIALLEVPVTDRSSLPAIWSAADEQVIAPENKARLEDNGFRIGVVGGIPPAALLDLLMSPRTNPNPHQWQRKAGDGRLLTLGGVRPECRVQVLSDGEPTERVFQSAQCGMQMTPGVHGDSFTLTISPQIQHGTNAMWPAPDGAGGWAMQGQRAVEQFPGMQFELTLNGSEYVLVGPRGKAGTLGAVCFAPAPDRPRQHILVLRVSRPNASTVGSTTGSERTPSLAAQAVATQTP